MPKLFGDVRREGGEDDDERLEDGALRAFQSAQLVHANHEGADGGIVREVLDIVGHFLNQFVERLELFGSRFAIRHLQRILVAIEQPPELLQETVHAVDAVRIPRFGLLDRTEEHFIETKCIGTVLFDNHIRIHDIVHRLRHLLDRPAADVLAIFQDKFRIIVFRTPVLEGFDIQDIVRDDIHIHVERRNIVLVFQIIRYKCIGIFDTINEV